MSLEVGVIGGGAWGTALACVAARAGHRVRLWARESEAVAAINTQHENPLFLPGIDLPETISATGELAPLGRADVLLHVAPAQHLRAVSEALAPHLSPGVPIALCAKGVELATGKLMSEVLAEAAPGARPAVLSGPSFAADVARGLPTAVTLAARDEEVRETVREAVGLTTFRPYLSEDLIGAQIGGAVKNVLAIACGIVEGLGLGASARAALITRGFAEMSRFGLALGARAETLAGLSGLGDLILTASSDQSRNYSLGRALGEGRPLEEILSARRSVTEGVITAGVVRTLAATQNVEMPIAGAVAAIVAGESDIDTAMTSLLNRPFRAEALHRKGP